MYQMVHMVWKCQAHVCLTDQKQHLDHLFQNRKINIMEVQDHVLASLVHFQYVRYLERVYIVPLSYQWDELLY